MTVAGQGRFGARLVRSLALLTAPAGQALDYKPVRFCGRAVAARINRYIIAVDLNGQFPGRLKELAATVAQLPFEALPP